LPQARTTAKLDYMATPHRELWQKHRALVWSNPNAADAVWIRAALLRPQFERLLDIALEFGLERLRQEWAELLAENTPETCRAQPTVERILNNIEKGFSHTLTRH